MIDTHTHLYLKEFDNDRQQVIDNAINSGIQAFILPNVDQTTLNPLIELSCQYPGICIPTVGTHPTSIKGDFIKEIEIVERALEEGHFFAIGEIGIDLYWDKTYIEQQIVAFDLQIKLAIKYNLPIIVHTRNSFEEVYHILKKYSGQNLKGVFHCFSGSEQQGKRIVDLGFKLGIGGVVTYKNSGLASTLKSFDLKDIVLETDSPYLAPVPYRGVRNEPLYIWKVAEKIGDIFQKKVEIIQEITTQNAFEMFNLDIP